MGDVTSDELYKTLEELGVLSKIDYLINNAGLARGKERAHEVRVHNRLETKTILTVHIDVTGGAFGLARNDGRKLHG